MRCAITRAIRATEKSAFAGGGQSRVLGDSVADLASLSPTRGTPVHCRSVILLGIKMSQSSIAICIGGP
jgi:hypothetical protein